MAQVVTDEVIAPTDSPRVASPRSTRLWLAVVLGLATLLRVLWVLHAARPTRALNDPYFYTVFGEQIREMIGRVSGRGDRPQCQIVPKFDLVAVSEWLVRQLQVSAG